MFTAAWFVGTGIAAAATPMANGGLILQRNRASSRPAVSYLTAPDGSHPVRMNFGGDIGGAAYTPDGRRIAFSRDGDIYTANTDGSGLTRLTSTSAADEEKPSWSPDGRHIAYERNVYAGAESSQIWVMTDTGTNKRQITTAATSGDLASAPAWSPDGKLIAFRNIRSGALCNHIWVVRPDGTHLRALTSCHPRRPGGQHDDLGPSWSPDGTRIAFERWTVLYEPSGVEEPARIMVMRRDGTHVHAISPSRIKQAFGPHWSPDGTEIAFSRIRPHSIDAMLMRANGRDAVMLEARIQAGSWRPAACTVTGTNRPDRLTGTPGNDVICGRGGNDVIAGRGGTDIISGGAGSDTVNFGWAPSGVRAHLWAHATAQGTEYLSGIENMVGSSFADVIHAGAVNSLIRGRSGDDTIFAGRGFDQLYGGPGADTLDVRDGTPGDLADGGLGTDTCRADRGDLIRGC